MQSFVCNIMRSFCFLLKATEKHALFFWQRYEELFCYIHNLFSKSTVLRAKIGLFYLFKVFRKGLCTHALLCYNFPRLENAPLSQPIEHTLGHLP